MDKGLTYAGVGVDYDAMDPFKRAAQKAAQGVDSYIRRLGVEVVPTSRGESAFLLELPEYYLAHVEEGLGTKNLVADVTYKLTGKSYYDAIAQDTVAMIVNDLITLGALPMSVAMHLAVGDSGWFDDQVRSQDLVNGWARSCELAACAWGGGETPTLKGIVNPETCVLSGSAIGIISPTSDLIAGNVEDGDVIVLYESSGIHANGLTMARTIAKSLPDGYMTKLPGGRTYGEALLVPTHIYVPVIERLQDEGVDIHYAINITGHGWRKLMRLPKQFEYQIKRLPETHNPAAHELFAFMQRHGPISDEEAYGNFNMGWGFAVIVPESELGKVHQIGADMGKPFHPLFAGKVQSSEKRRVVIEPKDLVYEANTLGVR